MARSERDEEMRIIMERTRWQKMNLVEKIGSTTLAVAAIPFIMARNAFRSIRRKSPENPKP